MLLRQVLTNQNDGRGGGVSPTLINSATLWGDKFDSPPKPLSAGVWLSSTPRDEFGHRFHEVPFSDEEGTRGAEENGDDDNRRFSHISPRREKLHSKWRALRNTGASTIALKGAAGITLDELQLIPPILGFWKLTKKMEVTYTISERIQLFLGFMDSEGRSHETMHPASIFVTVWQILQTLFLLYIALGLPLRIGFESEMDCEPEIVKFDLFLDLFFIFDIGIQFFVGFRKNGVIETERKYVVHHYLHGMFLFDAVISFPVTWLQFFWGGGLCTDGSTSAFSGARLLRLLRLLRVVRAVKLFSSALLDKLPINQTILQLGKLIFGTLFVAHICACGFWFVKTLATDENIADFYINNSLVDAALSEKYVTSLYFACTMLSTVGFGDIHGTNTVERIYCVVVMLLGAGVFATVISSISNLVASSTSKEFLQNRRIRELNDFIFKHKVPFATASRLRTFFTHNFAVDEAAASMEWIRGLPTVLRSELCNYLAIGVLGKSPLFKGAPPEFVSAVFLSLRPLHVTAGDTVIQAGQQGTEMYIVFAGLVKLVYPRNAGFELLYPGDIFGENALLSEGVGDRRPVSVVAAEDTDLYVLQRSDLIQAVAPYDRMKDRFENFVADRKALLLKKLEENHLNEHRTPKSKTPSFLQTLGKILEKLKPPTPGSGVLNDVGIELTLAKGHTPRKISMEYPILPQAPKSSEGSPQDRKPNNLSPSDLARGNASKMRRQSVTWDAVRPPPLPRSPNPQIDATPKLPSETPRRVSPTLSPITVPPPTRVPRRENDRAPACVKEASLICSAVIDSLRSLHFQETFKQLSDLRSVGAKGKDVTGDANLQHALHVMWMMERLQENLGVLSSITEAPVSFD